ncbi:DUF1127 domain-containing protein [Mesorhizobium marinum]|uniref:DUF1127 domain-containing protein n=1 Tax=Mesorhizobium marinum TaxID=3228790 RepID=UPI0034666F9A
MRTLTASRTGIPAHSRARQGSWLLRVVSMIEGALQRRRSRLDLMELSDAQLKDIGVSRSEAFREANRPFWD